MNVDFKPLAGIAGKPYGLAFLALFIVYCQMIAPNLGEAMIWKKLRRLMAKHFNDEEFRTLCFDLRIDYDSLEGKGKMGKIRELIAYLDRFNRLDELLFYLKTERASVAWPGIPDPSTQESEDNPARIAVWNALYRKLWTQKTFLNAHKGKPPLIDKFSVDLWAEYINKPIDSRPGEPTLILQEVRKYFFSYDEVRWRGYLEYILNYWNVLNHYKPEPIIRAVNLALEQEGTGLEYTAQYEFNRFISGAIVSTSSPVSSSPSTLDTYPPVSISIDIPDNILKTIHERAETRHPDNFSTRKFVIDKEIQAWQMLQTYDAADVPKETLTMIFQQAEKKHPNNFSTQLFVVNREVQAWRDLHT